MAELKLDPFTRKVAKGMKDFGFKPKKGNGSNHRDWVYDGPKAKSSFNYTLQNKAKEKSRAGVLKGLRKKMLRNGVAEHDVEWIDRIALGLIALESGDDRSTIEEKLSEAITSKNMLEVAKLAFELGRLAGESDERYECRAIADKVVEFDAADKKRKTIRKIIDFCHRRFQFMLKHHIESDGGIEVTIPNYSYADPIEYDDALVSFYELEPKRFIFNEEEDNIRAHGDFNGSIEAVFKKHGLTPRFTVVSDTLGGMIYSIKEPEMFFYFDIPDLHWSSQSIADELLEAIEKRQVEIELHN